VPTALENKHTWDTSEALPHHMLKITSLWHSWILQKALYLSTLSKWNSIPYSTTASVPCCALFRSYTERAMQLLLLHAATLSSVATGPPTASVQLTLFNLAKTWL